MRTLLALLLAATLGGAELKVGDAAPSVRPELMLQGDPVKEFRKGETYVVECWASWCGPCVKAIPHLQSLHEKMSRRGVTVVGVNVWEAERDAAGRQRAKDFVKKQGAAMGYRVAIGGEAFVKAWLEAAGVQGIPHAFIVQDGKVAWSGHPMEITEQLLGDVITGTHIPSASSASAPAPMPTPKLPGLDDESAEIARLQEKLNALARALARKDWDAAERALPEAAGVLPPVERKEMLESVGARIALGRGDPYPSYRLLEKHAEDEADDAETQNEVAWDLVTHPVFLAKPNLALAARCAERAVKLTQEKHPDKLDTLARVRWLQGRKAEALRLQELAVTSAQEPQLKVELQETLDSMRKGELPPADPIPDELR
ncbi:MAG: TlpA family protein disulfide reductase [Verrucomicrobia bacterium]|nr:TlpA family protein disulfide reductase [Verrucomicrobiota bacterium]